MEKTNRKKGLMIFMIVLIVLLFVFGIIFTLVTNARQRELEDLLQKQEQIELFDKNIPDTEKPTTTE